MHPMFRQRANGEEYSRSSEIDLQFVRSVHGIKRRLIALYNLLHIETILMTPSRNRRVTRSLALIVGLALAFALHIGAPIIPGPVAHAQNDDFDESDFDDFDDDDFGDDDFDDDFDDDSFGVDDDDRFGFGDDDEFGDDDDEFDDDDDEFDDEFDDDDGPGGDDDDDEDDDLGDDDERGIVGNLADYNAYAGTYEADEDGFPARRGEVLVFGLDEERLSRATALGFEVLESSELESIDSAVLRLSVPDHFPTTMDAINGLQRIIPAAPFDYNHIFELPERRSRVDGPIAQRPSSANAAPGQGIRLGIVDTLVDATHPSLRSQSIVVKDFGSSGGRDTVHATAVVSIIAGSDERSGYTGLLPGSEVFAANVFAFDITGRPSTTAFTMATALDWLASQDVGVINASIAGPHSDVLEAVLQRLQQRGHHVVAAVGNEGPGAPPMYPAAYADVTGVTAVDESGRVYRQAGRGAHVDFAAPGVGITAALSGGTYARFTGTSFATAVVSAVLARRLRTRDEGRSDSVAGSNSTFDLGSPGWDATYGHGLIDLDAVVED